MTAGVDGQVYRDTEQAWADPVVVSVQSRVAMGHVGNSAAVLPLQLAGFEVVEVATTLLSNHPFYPGVRGGPLGGATVAGLLDGVAERGVGAAARAVVSGFLATADVAAPVARFVGDARAANPGLRYVCDPVLGDTGPGLYVDPGLVAATRDRLLPLADVATPNAFELDLLAGGATAAGGGATAAQVAARARSLPLRAGGVVVVTGTVLADTPPGHLDTLVVAVDAAWRLRGPRVERHFDGTGDVFTALFTAAWLGAGGGPDAVVQAAGAAVAGTAEVVKATVAAGTKELRLVASAAAALRAVPVVPHPA